MADNDFFQEVADHILDTHAEAIPPRVEQHLAQIINKPDFTLSLEESASAVAINLPPSDEIEMTVLGASDYTSQALPPPPNTPGLDLPIPV